MYAKLGGMKEAIPPSWYVVTEPEMARALSNPKIRSWLAPFMKDSMTIKDVAHLLELSLNQMLYKVRRLQQLKLLRVAYEKQRKGRAIKYYQAVARRFFVPYDASPFASPAEWLMEDYREREQQLAKHVMRAGLSYGRTYGKAGKYGSFGKRIFFRDDGIFEEDFTFSPQQEADFLEADAPALSSFFVTTDLSFEDAKALQLEIAQLMQRYERNGEGQPYLLRLALAPMI